MNKNFPFTNVREASVAAWRERGLLREIAAWLAAFPQASAAIDDDCALLEARRERRLVTVDSLIFGRHFDESVSAFDAGRKLVARNLSDIAANGGVPSDAVIALVMSGDVAQGWLKEFYRGMLETCERYNLKLVGGDVASVAGTHFFSASMTISGFAGTHVLRRTGANVGDFICVSGTLGGSIRRKHFAFEPQLALGQLLAEKNLASACMDLTDGLAKDLPALVPAGTHAALDFSAIPLSEDAGGNVKAAFVDGEDYELLWTMAPEKFEQLRALCGNMKITKIGEIVAGTAGAGTDFDGGFEHF